MVMATSPHPERCAFRPPHEGEVNTLEPLPLLGSRADLGRRSCRGPEGRGGEQLVYAFFASSMVFSTLFTGVSGFNPLRSRASVSSPLCSQSPVTARLAHKS